MMTELKRKFFLEQAQMFAEMYDKTLEDEAMFPGKRIKITFQEELDAKVPDQSNAHENKSTQ